MCKMFNLTPEDLSYKWEALSYNSTRKLNIFTMESAAALKTKIQRDLTADNAKKQAARPRLAGSVVRGRAPVLKTGHPRAVASSSGASAAGVTVKEEMKMDGIAGPSSVDFKRPIVDTTLKSNRACKHPTGQFLSPYLRHLQIGTCTRKLQNEVKVGALRVILYLETNFEDSSRR
jgi:DNA polymerase alpha subunit B